VKVGVNNTLTPSDGNYIYHFPLLQPTHAHNCHLIHNNIFKNVKTPMCFEPYSSIISATDPNIV